MSDPIDPIINTPASTPPTTPHADARHVNDPGEPVGQVAFDMKMGEINNEMAAINRRIDTSTTFC